MHQTSPQHPVQFAHADLQTRLAMLPHLIQSHHTAGRCTRHAGISGCATGGRNGTGRKAHFGERVPRPALAALAAPFGLTGTTVAAQVL
ncbi:MAG: hypothetical protein Tsb0027_01370 [Wenzhouxiangellaceae bacterium]